MITTSALLWNCAIATVSIEVLWAATIDLCVGAAGKGPILSRRRPAAPSLRDRNCRITDTLVCHPPQGLGAAEIQGF